MKRKAADTRLDPLASGIASGRVTRRRFMEGAPALGVGATAAAGLPGRPDGSGARCAARRGALDGAAQRDA